MIISSDQKQYLKKIQHPFMIKSIQQTRNRNKLPQFDKGNLLITHSSHHTQW